MPRVVSCAPHDRSKVPHGSLSPLGCSALRAVSRTLEACLFAAKGDRPLWGCIPSPLATLALIGLHRAAPSMPRFPSIPCKHARSESLPLSLASPVSDTGLVVGLRAVTRASVQPLRCGVRTSNGARLCGTLGAVLCVLTPRLQPKGARTIRESGVSPSVPGLIPLEARWHSLCIMSLQAEARRTLCRWRVFQTSQFPVCCALVGTHS
jgi:hypothetical protein